MSGARRRAGSAGLVRLSAGALLLYLSVGAGMTARTVYTAATSRTGGAAHYPPNLMERVARNRGMTPGPCDVAITHNHEIGAWVTITRLATGRSERCRIVDVCNAAKGHCRALARRGIVAELGWPAAKRLCQLRYVNQEPPRKCRVTVQ